MDPISIVGLLGALCHLLEASSQLIKAVKTLKDGERDFLELYHDITLFEEALRGFDRVLRRKGTDHNISATVMTNAIRESSRTINELNERLLPILKSESSAIRRMRWLQNRSTVRKLHERIKTQCSMLQSFLTLVHAETFFNAYDHYPQLLQISAITDTNSRRESAISIKTNDSETSTLISTTSRAPSSCISTDTAPSSLDDAESLLQKTVSNPVSEISKSDGDNYSTESSLIRKACRFDCYCKCHPRTRLKEGDISSLSKSLSKLEISNYDCDDVNCESNKAISVGSSTRFFQKILCQVKSAQSIKVRHHMSTFHIVPESSDVLRYVKLGKLDSLQIAIQSGKATLWDTAPDGWSLLHTAAYNRQLPIVKYLLRMGADVNSSDVGARKPADLALMNSLLSGATQIERDINDAFAQKDDYLSSFDFTPVHIAVLDLYEPNDVERPSLEEILTLVDECNNASPGTNWKMMKMKYKKRSPLFGNVIEYFRASSYEQPKNSKIIHHLIDKKDRSLCWTPLHWACSTGKRDKIRILIFYGADPSILSNLKANILHAAAESKALGGLEDALNVWRRDPSKLNINELNYWAETPLHVAAWGSAHNVELLVEAGADRNAQQEDGQVPLHCAGMTARGKVRKRIIDLLCAGNEPLHINTQDNDGRPPLFDFLDEASCVKMLVGYGASIELLDEAGQSAFHHACKADYEETLELLLQLSGSDSVLPTVKDHDGNTALNLALSHGSRNCALALLGLKDVGDMVGQNGWAAVHHAAKLGDYDILQAVLEHRNYVPGLKTVDGKTVEVVAMEAGTWHGEIRDLIRRHNAKI